MARDPFARETPDTPPPHHGLSLRVQSAASSLVLGLCVVGWIGGIILMVYVPVYAMVADAEGGGTGGAGGESTQLAKAVEVGKWLSDGGWRIAVPVLGAITVAAAAWRMITVVRLFRARRRALG